MSPIEPLTVSSVLISRIPWARRPSVAAWSLTKVARAAVIIVSMRFMISKVVMTMRRWSKCWRGVIRSSHCRIYCWLMVVKVNLVLLKKYSQSWVFLMIRCSLVWQKVKGVKQAWKYYTLSIISHLICRWIAKRCIYWCIFAMKRIGLLLPRTVKSAINAVPHRC